MKNKKPFLLLIAMLVSTSWSIAGTQKAKGDSLREGNGMFVFTHNALPDKPVKVFYYRPKGLPHDAPIMILMHGTLRNAETYRKNMAAYADKHQFLLITPEFSKEKFPASRDYHQGGVFEKDKTMKDKSDWTFSMIEPLFDAVKEKSGKKNAGYILYGFSAGSQFIHRFTWFVPENRAIKTVSSSAGSYTLPDFKINYPYGLKRTKIPKENLVKAFAKDFTVLVGAADTVLSDKYLPKGDAATRQGRDRVERAKNFYEMSKAKAAEMGVPFNWKLMIVPDIAHENGKMAASVTEMLFGRKK